MNIKDLVEETGYNPKRKAACHGGEYCSPCPFCKDGDDRFLTWPERTNKNGEYQGGRFSCRICGKYGDAINFLRQLYGMSYRDACAHLRIEPKQRSGAAPLQQEPKLRIVEDPPPLWKDKAKAFINWAHTQLMNNKDGLALLLARGFTDESINRFGLGYNPRTFFRGRPDWGLPDEIKEDGKLRKLWLPAGLVIPTFSAEGIVKIKIRRSEWKEGDKLPKYAEVSGSKQSHSVYGDTSLPGLILESELDALLIQQEAGDLVFSVALGGSTKPLDAYTDQLIRKTAIVLFLPDFDKAGAVAWVKWKKKFQGIHRILTPLEKSAGDAFLAGINLREWISDSLDSVKRELRGK
jgi:DNA primase